MTPSERRMAATIAAYACHAKYGSDAIAGRARKGFRLRFENEVDPDRVLPEAERARRAESAMRAHMQRMALRSAQARRVASKETGGRK